MTPGLPDIHVNLFLLLPPRTSRFGDNPREKTIYGIERVVEWVEAQNKPFTNSQAFRACYAGWTTTYLTLLDLRDHGLIRRVNPPNAKPGLWIRADAPLETP